MVVGDKSGVMFTTNPITGDENETVIESSYGLNMAVVDGVVTADQHVINNNGEITSRTITQKKIKYSLGNKSFELQIENVENNMQQVSCLADDEAQKLAKIGRHIESIFGFPCDIEWTIAEDKIYILQCRPIVLHTHTHIQTLVSHLIVIYQMK